MNSYKLVLEFMLDSQTRIILMLLWFYVGLCSGMRLGAFSKDTPIYKYLLKGSTLSWYVLLAVLIGYTAARILLTNN